MLGVGNADLNSSEREHCGPAAEYTAAAAERQHSSAASNGKNAVYLALKQTSGKMAKLTAATCVDVHTPQQVRVIRDKASTTEVCLLCHAKQGS